MYYLGIDLGGTNIAVGVVDENCKIVKKGSVPTKAEREADEIIADMAKLCKDLVADCSLTMDDIEYAGIATPGTANRHRNHCLREQPSVHELPDRSKAFSDVRSKARNDRE